MKKLINWILNLLEERKRKKRLQKKIEELKKRDPFVYKH